VADTGVDALAIAIGTSHGAYKFTRPPTGDILAIERIKEIHASHPQHAPGDARLLVRAAGVAGASSTSTAARSSETYGVPVEQIGRHPHGVRKVNIDTDLRLASTGAMRRFMAENPAEFDPRKWPRPSRP
jgi:fructose-bisphosphate aldolase class II